MEVKIVDKLSVFISSVVQDSLTTLRMRTKQLLDNLGHEGIIFEESIMFTELG